MKQVNPNPWDIINEKFPVGTRICGPIKNVTDFGLFVGLTEEVDGLVHISDVSWVRPARPLSALFPKKSDVDAVVLSIDAEAERISLGLKQLIEDPWPRLHKDFGIGTRHQGKVVWVGEKGMAVEMEPGIEGFVGKSELPEEMQENLAQHFTVGREVEAVVHSVDEKELRISVGLVL
jgi:small subunit ribosomal protein S1